MLDLINKLDSEQVIIMAMQKDDAKANITLNCDETLPAALLEMIQTNAESKRALQDIHMILTMVLTADKNDERMDAH